MQTKTGGRGRYLLDLIYFPFLWTWYRIFYRTPEIIYFGTDSLYAVKGNWVTLAWHIEGALFIHISGIGYVEKSGTAVIDVKEPDQGIYLTVKGLHTRLERKIILSVHEVIPVRLKARTEKKTVMMQSVTTERKKITVSPLTEKLKVKTKLIPSSLLLTQLEKVKTAEKIHELEKISFR